MCTIILQQLCNFALGIDRRITYINTYINIRRECTTWKTVKNVWNQTLYGKLFLSHKCSCIHSHLCMVLSGTCIRIRQKWALFGTDATDAIDNFLLAVADALCGGAVRHDAVEGGRGEGERDSGMKSRAFTTGHRISPRRVWLWIAAGYLSSTSSRRANSSVKVLHEFSITS